MKTLAVHVSGGIVQGFYEIENSPHDRIILIDDDQIREVEPKERKEVAKGQLNGYDVEGQIDYSEIHDNLSNYISSEEVNK